MLPYCETIDMREYEIMEYAKKTSAQVLLDAGFSEDHKEHPDVEEWKYW